MNKLSELSIFFPFWNEEKNVKAVITAAIPVAEEIAEKWEIIAVDDGSDDKTKQIAQELVDKDKRIRVISHLPNKGYGAALKEGFTHARYKYIVFTDGDRQFDFSEVKKFIEQIETADLVIGYRKKRRDHVIRHILMNLLKVWDLVLFGFHFKDIDCGFKMIRKDALEKIMPIRSDGAMATTELLAKAVAKKLKVVQVEVIHYPRTYGKSTGANITVIIRAMLESFILFLDIKSGRF